MRKMFHLQLLDLDLLYVVIFNSVVIKFLIRLLIIIGFFS